MLNDLDANEIRHGLWIGSAQPAGAAVAKAGFDSLVLCAIEYQIPSNMFFGVDVLHAGIDDNYDRMSEEDWKIAQRAADYVAAKLDEDKKVLVTCIAGRNRSGLVCALTLIRRGWSPENALTTIRQKRERALENPIFVRRLLRRRG